MRLGVVKWNGEVVARRVPLGVDRVIDAALRVADAEGIDAVTLRRLAQDLGVHPTSIYNHVPSKEAILDGLLERLLQEAQLPESFSEWGDWVRAFADALARLAAAHPGAFLVFSRRQALGPTALVQTEAALDAFRRAGLSAEQAGRAVAGTSLALLGLALNESPPVGPWGQPDAAVLSAREFPRIVEALAVNEENSSAMWALMVDSLISGLTAHAGFARPSGRRG